MHIIDQASQQVVHEYQVGDDTDTAPTIVDMMDPGQPRYRIERIVVEQWDDEEPRAEIHGIRLNRDGQVGARRERKQVHNQPFEAYIVKEWEATGGAHVVIPSQQRIEQYAVEYIEWLRV